MWDDRWEVCQMSDRVRELRLRRMAGRQGLALHKSRRRDPRALDFGKYWLTNAETNVRVGPETRDLDEIERYLTGESRPWKPTD
jgi:hypothetical protein